jgi:hypothetical protein
MIDLGSDAARGISSLVHAQSFAMFWVLVAMLYHVTHFFIPSGKGNHARVLGLSVVFVSYFIVFSYGLDWDRAFWAFELSLALTLMLVHPVIAVTLLLAFLILRPWEIAPNNLYLAVLPRLAMGMTAVSILIHYLAQGSLAIRQKNVLSLIGALFFWVFLSTWKTPDPAALQSYFFDNYFKVLIVCLLVFLVINNMRAYRVFADGLCASIFGLAVMALVNTFFVHKGSAADDSSDVIRLTGEGMLGNANDLAALMVLAIPFGLYYFTRPKQSIAYSLIAVAPVLVLIFCLIQARSRAAFLALGLAVGIFVITRLQIRRHVVAVSVTLGLILTLVASNSTLGRSSADLEESRTHRIGYWLAGWSMAIRNPLLGVGFNQFPENFANFGVGEFREGTQRTAHSTWVLVVAEAGFPALLLLVTLFGLALRRAYEVRFRFPELLPAVTGYGIAMTFLSHTYLIYPYVLIALILSIPKNAGQGAATA